MRIEPAIGNAYRLSRRFALVNSQAAGAVLWAFRNPANVVAQLLRCRLQFLQTGAPTAAIENRFSLFIARSYTASQTTGIGTAISPSAGKLKLTSSSADAQAVIQETNAAAGLTGGTATVDTEAIIRGTVWQPIAQQTASILPLVTIWDYAPFSIDQPLTIAKNEGFHITNDAVLGAAVNAVLVMEILWTERAT